MQQHRARKRFGQNFLTDQGVISAIASAVAARPSDRIIEIGPGLGALTEHLVDSSASVTAIELDRDLIPKLQSQFGARDNFKLLNEDALNVGYRALASENNSQGKLRIVGNLPYNISTPLLFKLLEDVDCVADMHFMLQKEVVNRLAAKPSSSNWGRLGIMTQYFCHVEHVLDVHPHSFSPAPKVDSAVVRLTPFESPPYIAEDFSLLQEVVRKAFNMRRKTLRNALNGMVDEKQMLDLDISPKLRPENLSLQQYVQLSNAVSSATSSAGR